VFACCDRSSSSPALPACPTRRSSDLRRVRALAWSSPFEVCVEGATARGSDAGLRSVCLPAPARMDHAHRPGGQAPRRGEEYVTRSEEHTSELQSRENIVCRLLLVKKN